MGSTVVITIPRQNYGFPASLRPVAAEVPRLGCAIEIFGVFDKNLGALVPQPSKESDPGGLGWARGLLLQLFGGFLSISLGLCLLGWIVSRNQGGCVCTHVCKDICTWPTPGVTNPVSHLWWAGKEWAWDGLERKLMHRVRWVQVE